MVADKRDGWECYSDDPVMIAKLDKIAAGTPRGYGVAYRLRADQVLFRRGKPVVSDAVRKARSERMKSRQRQTPELVEA